MSQHALDFGTERMRWSAYQQAIFAKVEDTDGGNIAVRARAGTGKTTVIAECVRRMPRRARILVCAFNRDIREELARRLPLGVDVLTTHGLGMRAVQRAQAHSRLDKDKLKRMVAAVWPALDAGPWRTAASKLIARAKATLARTPEELDACVDAAGICLEDLVPRARRTRHGLSPEQAAELRGQLVEEAGKLLIACAESPETFDFDEMLWLPVVHSWSPGAWDWVVVDEAQDLSRVQLELIASSLAPGGRVLIVGDDHQCHPAGTMIDVGDGRSVPIEQLVDGQAIRGWCQKSQRMLGKRKVEMGVRPYQGDMLHVSVDVDGETRSVAVTPNHRFVARWAVREDHCVTYLMHRHGFGYRVGWCKLFTKTEKGIGFHLPQRARLEKADAVWVLAVHTNRTDASVYESIVAGRYGIPTATFEPVHGATHLTAPAIARIFGAMADVVLKRGERCLRDHGRHPAQPLYPWPKQDMADKQGRRTLFEIHASNLIPGLMAIPNPDKTNGWGTIREVRTEREFSGPVYSLNVEPDHSYSANGLVVLNSIYGFRGADAHAFDRLVERFACTVLPLSITYRCPTSVVDLARKLVPDYEAGEGAPVGSVTSATALPIKSLLPGDFVLSRKNAPLVRHAIKTLAAGIPAAIAGRDLAKDLGLILGAMARRCGGDRERVLSALTEHYGRRLQEAAKREIDPGPISDELNCLLALLDARPAVQDSIDLLDNLCSEKPGNVVLFSSVHRAKGLERDRVWLLLGTFRASYSGAEDDGRPGRRGDAQAETNLLYVATTRAKKALVLVSGEG